MLRILRAFAWLRWRTLLNALDRPAARDALQRFSGAVEQLGSIIVALAMIPSAVSIAGTALFAGWRLSHEPSTSLSLEAIRFVLLAGSGLALAGPILLPGGGRVNEVRLLLLPIPRQLLFLSQALSSLADPWILLVAAAVVPLPLGTAAGGAFTAAATLVLAGLLLLAALTGLTALTTAAVQLVARDRRRGEILALILILALPAIATIPAVLGSAMEKRILPGWWTSVVTAAAAVVPSESYVRAARASARADYAAATPPILTIGALALVAHGASYMLFLRLLGSPGSGTTRRAGRARAAPWRLPGVRPDTAAVAANQVRLALRTSRGRSTMLSPIVVFVVFGLMLSRQVRGTEFLAAAGGVGLAAFACATCLLAIVPLAMNQFAIDGAGLTLMFLSPLKTGTLVAGKAIGNGIVALMPATVCFAGALLLIPGGDASLWALVPLVLVSTYLLAAPAAAVVSAWFPRAVDLNSIGQGSNAHAAAGLLGVLAFAAASAPALLFVLVTRQVLARPGLAVVLLLLWTVAAAALGAVLLKAAAHVVDSRRENLALVV